MVLSIFFRVREVVMQKREPGLVVMQKGELSQVRLFSAVFGVLSSVAQPKTAAKDREQLFLK